MSRRGRSFSPAWAALLLVAACLLLATPAQASAADASVDMSGAPKVEPSVIGSQTGTDPVTSERERESMSRSRVGEEKFEFQAEVARLMDIIINSLYSNKDIFLRELISNASDALDKIRFLALTDKGVLGEGDNSKLEIQISLSPDKKVLSIRDKGVGMTRDDLIKNLGTIAKSGTSAFLENMQKGGDINLIGQFGVGFYSVYLVADLVEVVTKHNDDKQYVWTSSASGGYSIAEDADGEQLGRGTMIKLHLKPEAMEYGEESKLRELVKRYSEFINFPIYMLTEKEVDVPIEDDAESTKEEASEEEETPETPEDDTEVEDEEEEEEEEKPATRKEKRSEWDLLNDAQAIWLRKPSEVKDEDYNKFYKSMTSEYQDPLGWAHFKAEGDVEFKAVLFVPKVSPHDFYDKYYEKGAKEALKLYIRRVFITDDVEDLLPRWLGFLRGVVDSDTLPLNVSREMMQQHAALKTIKKKIIRKVLDLFKRWAEDEGKCKAADKSEEEVEDKPSEEACKLFGQFWTQYGRAIKLGIIEDPTNRNRLAKLLRVYTSKSPDTLVSLDEYISNMKSGQNSIYYLAGSSKEEIGKSPFVEQLLRKGYEVIYFTDVLDEYVMQHMLEYEDKKFINASKEDLKLTDKDEVEKKRDKELKEEFRELTKWWKTTLGDQVSSVKVSTRLATTPCVVVAGKYGQSANMERIMRAQAFTNPNQGGVQKSQKVLEINPRHPLVRGLKDKLSEEMESSEEVSNLAKLLFDAAVLESGFHLEEPKTFSSRIQNLVRASLGVPADAEVELEEVGSEEEQDGSEEGSQEEGEEGSEGDAEPAAPSATEEVEEGKSGSAKDEL